MKPRSIAALLLVVFALAFALALVHATPIQKKSSPTFNYPDALTPPDSPTRNSKTREPSSALSSSPSPGYYETSEYLIGSVSVGVIFLESNGIIDPSTETWTPSRESQVVSEIRDSGLSWLANYNPNANVSFVYDIHYKVPTSYEPINRPYTDQGLWIDEAMTYLGYPGLSYFAQVRDFINDLRNNRDTDWAFAIFVVDSYYDWDGEFTDGYSAYAYLGGPFLVMTYDNGNYGIGNMDWVSAHETAHIFYATDEYDNEVEYSGYLNAPDTQYTTSCLMGQPIIFLPWSICANTQYQLGWRDSDTDGLQDIVDTFPNTALNPYLPDPTTDSTPTYTGTVVEVPYPNSNPNGPGTDVTINTIAKVEYRLDSGSWFQASALDGVFDEAEESFTFTTSTLSLSTHTIETRGINSVGNKETSFASDTVTVIADQTSPVTSLSYSSPSHVSGTNTYVSGKTSFTLTASDTGSGVARTHYRIDSTSWTLYYGPFSLSALSDGTHTLDYYSVDKVGNTEAMKSFKPTIDNTEPTVSLVIPYNENAVSSSNVSVSWNGSDSGSGIDHYETKMDSGGYLNKGTATSHLYSILSEGSHRAYIKAFDRLGNTKEIQVVFLVDISMPKVSLTSPSPQTLTNSSNVKAVWKGTDTVSGIDHCEVKLDEETWLNVGSLTIYSTSGITDGTHELTVKAVDKAGNSAVSSVVFIVDTTPPSVTLTNSTKGNVIRSSIITVDWSGLDEVSGINHYEVKIDEDAWFNVGTNTTYTLNQIGDGSHAFHVKAVDNVGNVRETQTDFSVNTSLIGGPGWVDDALFFGAVSVVIVLIAVIVLSQKRKNRAVQQEKGTDLLQE